MNLTCCWVFYFKADLLKPSPCLWGNGASRNQPGLYFLLCSPGLVGSVWGSGCTENIQHSSADNLFTSAVNLSCWQSFLFIYPNWMSLPGACPCQENLVRWRQVTLINWVIAKLLHQETWNTQCHSHVLKDQELPLPSPRGKASQAFSCGVPQCWSSFRKRIRLWGSAVPPHSERAATQGL